MACAKIVHYAVFVFCTAVLVQVACGCKDGYVPFRVSKMYQEEFTYYACKSESIDQLRHDMRLHEPSLGDIRVCTQYRGQCEDLKNLGYANERLDTLRWNLNDIRQLILVPSF